MVALDFSLIASSVSGVPSQCAATKPPFSFNVFSRSAYAPVRGYRYDGLYRVSGEWKERGRAGFLVWRFRLEKMAGEK